MILWSLIVFHLQMLTNSSRAEIIEGYIITPLSTTFLFIQKQSNKVMFFFLSWRQRMFGPFWSSRVWGTWCVCEWGPLLRKKYKNSSLDWAVFFLFALFLLQHVLFLCPQDVHTLVLRQHLMSFRVIQLAQLEQCLKVCVSFCFLCIRLLHIASNICLYWPGHGEDYRVQSAVNQCPRNCIHYVTPSQRIILEELLDRYLIHSLYITSLLRHYSMCLWMFTK